MLLFVVLWTECLCPSAPRSYVEILMPNVMVLGGAGFEGCLSLEGGVLCKNLWGWGVKPRERSCPFHHVRRWQSVDQKAST